MSVLRIFVALSFVCLCHEKSLRASYVMSFAVNEQIGNSFDVVENSFINVKVYLGEEDTTTLTDDGLIGAGVMLTFSPTFGNSSISNGSLPIAFSNFSFDDSGVGYYGFAGVVGPLDPAVKMVGSNPILIGTFQIDSGTVGNTTVFSAVDFSEDFGDTVLGDSPNFSSIDADVFASMPTFSVNTVSAVPEPSSCLLLATVFGSGILYQRRRRHRVG